MKRVWLFLLLIAFFYIVFYYNSVIDVLFSRFYLMANEDEPRIHVFSQYLNLLDESFRNFIVGIDLKDVSSISELDLNPHNSYISLHAQFGLLGLSVALLIAFVSTKILFVKREWLMLSLLIGLLIRSSTDISMFYGPLDPIFFAMYFWATANNRGVNEKLYSRIY